MAQQPDDMVFYVVTVTEEGSESVAKLDVVLDAVAEETEDSGSSDIGGPVQDSTPQAVLADVVDPPPIFESSACGEAPKLELIVEVVDEQALLGVAGSAPFLVGCGQEAQVAAASAELAERPQTPSGCSDGDHSECPTISASGDPLKAPHLSELVLPKNYTELSGLRHVSNSELD